jgi:predicted nucleic acid-binding protein
MGWVEALRGSVVGLDTAPLVYYTEQNSEYLAVVDPFFDAIDRSEITVVTSIITLLEALIHPIQHNNTKLAQQYRDFLFNTDGVAAVFLDQAIAEEAARLRAVHKLRVADAIQIATAISQNASFFLTNDKRLSSLPYLQVLTVDELKTRP